MNFIDDIIAGNNSDKIIYEDNYTIAIYDKYPQAPVHVLVFPKMHTDSLETVDNETLVQLVNTIREVAKITKIDKSGYRVITNVGENSRQTVSHLHFHVLGGRMVKSGILFM